MANFDSNQWYHLYVNENKDNALIGTNLITANNTAGAVFYQSANATSERQHWQFFPINDTYYVLRTKEGGPDAFLGAMFSKDETTPGQTRAYMTRGDVSDDGIFWQVSPWGDGTFFFTNKKNGTEWHLKRKLSDGLVAMDSNTTSMPKGQRWSFENVANIESDVFSTVDLPGVSTTTSAPPSATSTDASSSSNPSTPSPQSSGTSAGTRAAIGGSIGGVALIALIILGLFFWRRRRRTQLSPMEKSVEADSHGSGGAVRHELSPDSTAKHEMPVTPCVELPQNVRPAELEGGTAGYKAR